MYRKLNNPEPPTDPPESWWYQEEEEILEVDESDDLDDSDDEPEPLILGFFKDVWLPRMDEQLALAKRLFSGKPVSAVLLDPLGTKYPREWKGHMLVYVAGIGVCKGPKNQAYGARCICQECRQEAA